MEINETELEPAGQTREPEDRIEAYRAARRMLCNMVPKTGGTMTGNLTIPAPTADGHAVNREYVYTSEASATLTAAGWVGESAPFTQTVTVAGLKEGRRCMVYPKYGDDADGNLSVLEACACISYAKRSGSDVTFTCLEEKPEVDIDVVLEVYV